jgi:hypothetical protein
LIAAILFAIGATFWGLSTWLVSEFIFRQHHSFVAVPRVVGLAYAAQVFNFLVALPYLGVPILVVLSIWSLLAFLTGMGATLGMDTWQAFLCGALGWAVFQVLQRTIGRPVASMGRWLTNTAAGTRLVTDLKSLEQRLDRRMQRRRRIRN